MPPNLEHSLQGPIVCPFANYKKVCHQREVPACGRQASLRLDDLRPLHLVFAWLATTRSWNPKSNYTIHGIAGIVARHQHAKENRIFQSFQEQVLPELNRRGIAALGMKPISGHGEPVMNGAVTAEEALRYAMSLPVTTTITGIDSLEILQQNLRIAQGFRPMSETEMQALRDRVKSESAHGRFELYKVSLKFDNPEARLAHGFPLERL